MAKPNVLFVGRVSDAQRRELMARCRALIFPGEEDFGITPLEANASGRPVIAFAGGGTVDSIVEGMNGVVFRSPAAESLIESVSAFDPSAFDPVELRAHAEKFDLRVFQQELCGQLDVTPSLLLSPANPKPSQSHRR
jgi:glycosyltransferase involved in cell wall biosynthesis